MTRRYTILFAAGVVGLLVLAALLVVILLALVVPEPLESGVMRTAALVFLGFLGILLVRYLLLLWLGYLQHLERGVTAKRPASAGYRPPVTILVPAYNEGVVIQSALRSLLRQDYPRFEVLVIDDGSTDDTYQKAVELEGQYGGAAIRVVSKRNGGKAAALNTGIAMARHPFVVCMDGDSALSPNALADMVPHFADPKVAAVAGNVKVANRRNLWSRLQALEYIEGLNMARRAQSFMRAVNIIPGPLGMFRRDVLVKIGGYDTDTYAEDADLTLKLLADDWRIEYEDRAIAYTEAPESIGTLLKQRYRWTRGILQALRKRKSTLFGPGTNLPVRLSLAMMSFEAVVWPFMNVVANLFFVLIAVGYGAGTFLVGWWLLLTLLDVAAALHTVAMEEEDLALVPLAVIYRFFFILLIDVAKLLATFEEALNVEMTWGKLDRLGRI